MKILVLDDQLPVAESICDAILDINSSCELVTCLTVKDALEKVKEESFDLYVLDYHLANGLATRLLQEISPKSAIILYTGLPNVPPELEMLKDEFPCLVFLRKPFTCAELRRAIEQTMTCKGG